MTSKLLAAAAFSLGLIGASLAFAQTGGGTEGGGGTSNPDVMTPGGGGGATGTDGTDSGTTRSTSPDSEDLSSYLTGSRVRPFYTDESLNTLRPRNELQETFNAMSLDERIQLRAACAMNQDAKYNGLCSSVSAMQ